MEFTSFEWDAAAELKRVIPLAKVGMLVLEFDPAAIARVAAAGFNEICPSVKAVTRESIHAAHAIGLTVSVYGVRDRADLQRANDLGAEGTTLNWPDWVERPPAH